MGRRDLRLLTLDFYLEDRISGLPVAYRFLP